MHAALRFLVVSDLPSVHKRVLIDVLTQVLRAADAEELRLRNAREEPPPWRPEEIARLESLLEHRIARSWQHADEILLGAAAQLRRSPADIRAKATQLGRGAAVDYAIAKAQAAASDASP